MRRFIAGAMGVLGAGLLLSGVMWGLMALMATIPWTDVDQGRFLLSIMCMVVGAVLLIGGIEVEAMADARDYLRDIGY